jgi:hypothetical protein
MHHGLLLHIKQRFLLLLLLRVLCWWGFTSD